MRKAEVNAIINQRLLDGTINQEQARTILADVETTLANKSSSLFTILVTLLGATTLALGVLLLIGFNWEYMPRGGKLICALMLPTLPLGFAYWRLCLTTRLAIPPPPNVTVKRHSQVLPRAAALIGLLLVAGSLAIIGQTYHIDGNMVSFLWTWTLLTLPFVFIFKKTENVLFAAILTGSALLFWVFEIIENSEWVTVSKATLLLTVVSLGYAAGLYVLGSGLRHVNQWLASGRWLRLFGGGLAAIILFVMTFEAYARSVLGYDYYYYYYADEIVFWQPLSIALNLLFVGFLMFALLRAVKYQELAFAFNVVRLFCLYLLVKYCTLFFSILETALTFITGGIILITIGWLLERHKNFLIAFMKNRLRFRVMYDQS